MIKISTQSRKAAFKILRTDNLCKTLFDGPRSKAKCPYEKCKFIHDVDEYMKHKPCDISETCYIFSTKGYCRRGVTCRFAYAHLDEDLNNCNRNDNEVEIKTTSNQISNGK